MCVWSASLEFAYVCGECAVLGPVGTPFTTPPPIVETLFKLLSIIQYHIEIGSQPETKVHCTL